MNFYTKICLAVATAFALGLPAACKAAELSVSDIDHLIDAHNSERKLVNVDALIWDDGLAMQSLDYAEQCIWAHSKGANKGGKYGENLAMSSPELKVQWGTYWWISEKKYVNSKGKCVIPDTDKYATCGHYLQIVKSGNKRFGCAMAYCTGSVWGSGGDYLVCQYSKSEKADKPGTSPTNPGELPLPKACRKKENICASKGEEHKRCTKFTKKCNKALEKQAKKNNRNLLESEESVVDQEVRELEEESKISSSDDVSSIDISTIVEHVPKMHKNGTFELEGDLVVGIL